MNEGNAPSQALPRQLPQGGSQDLKSVTKVLGTMRKCPAALLPLPLGEVASPQAMTERAHAVCPVTKASGAMRNFPAAQKTPSQALPRQLPQGGSQDLKSVTKVLGTMRKCPAALLPLPLGEVASPQAMTERAHAVCPVTKASGAMRNFPAAPEAPSPRELAKPQALAEGVTQKNTPAGLRPRGCYYAIMFPAPLRVQSRKHGLLNQ